MKRLVFACITSLLALSACGGGGSSSSVPTVVYSPVGTFAGTVNSQYEGEGALALRVYADGSGEVAINYPGHPIIDLGFSAVYGHISGSSFNISQGTIAIAGVDTGCPFSLQGTMQSADEMDGSYTVGNNTPTCGNTTTIPFRISRAAGTQTQSFAKAGPNETLVGH